VVVRLYVPLDGGLRGLALDSFDSCERLGVVEDIVVDVKLVRRRHVVELFVCEVEIDLSFSDSSSGVPAL
jgi:hypothetical protein